MTPKPEETTADHLNRLRGRLCGLIESWDLEPKVERAMISTLKTMTYDAEAAIKESIATTNFPRNPRVRANAS